LDDGISGPSEARIRSGEFNQLVMESESLALILNPHPTSYDALVMILQEEEGD
jgi:hypothetical protein